LKPGNKSADITASRAHHNVLAMQSALRKVVDNGIAPGAGAIIRVEENCLSAFSGLANVERNTRMGPSSRFEISCFMKFMISALCIRLADEQILDLNAPLGSYLPELRGGAYDKASAIKLVHLLTHTSGYRGLDISDAKVKWGLNWDKFAKYFRETEQLFIPGQVFNYEHSEHVLLGEVLRKMTGQSPLECVQSFILDPLGIRFDPIETHTKEYIENDDLVCGYEKADATFRKVNLSRLASFWESSLPNKTLTLHEIAEIGAAFFSKNSPFSRSAVSHLSEIFVSVPTQHVEPSGERSVRSFGLLGAIYSNGAIGHNGSTAGQTIAIRFMPEMKAVVVVGLNSWAAGQRDALASWLEAAVSGTPRHLKNSSRAASQILAGFSPEKLAGVYVGSLYGAIEVTWNGEHLEAIASRAKDVSLFKLRCRPEGPVTLTSKAQGSFSFSANPEDGSPLLMLGSYAYKKHLGRIAPGVR